MVKSCEVCDSNNIEEALDIGNHALCDDLIKIDDYRENKKYPIEFFAIIALQQLINFANPQMNYFQKNIIIRLNSL